MVDVRSPFHRNCEAVDLFEVDEISIAIIRMAFSTLAGSSFGSPFGPQTN